MNFYLCFLGIICNKFQILLSWYIFLLAYTSSSSENKLKMDFKTYYLFFHEQCTFLNSFQRLLFINLIQSLFLECYNEFRWRYKNNFPPIFTLWGRFHQHQTVRLSQGLTNMFIRSFYALRSQKHQKTVKLSVSFCTFGIFSSKGCSRKWWRNWPQWSHLPAQINSNNLSNPKKVSTFLL